MRKTMMTMMTLMKTTFRSVMNRITSIVTPTLMMMPMTRSHPAWTSASTLSCPVCISVFPQGQELSGRTKKHLLLGLLVW